MQKLPVKEQPHRQARWLPPLKRVMMQRIPAKAKLRQRLLSTAAYLLVAGAVIYSIVKLLGGEEHLAYANYFFLLLAVCAYLSSMFFWAVAWAYHGKIPVREASLLTFCSVAGTFTPLGLGSDALRGYFSKRRDRDLSRLVASSVATKFHKIIVTSALGLLYLLLSWKFLDGEIAAPAFAGVILSLLSVLAIWVAAKYFGSFSRHVPKKFVPSFVSYGSDHIRQALSTVALPSLSALVISAFFEFAALYLSFLAFGADPGFLVVAGTYVVLFFASKVPFLHGFGLLQLVGVLLLRGLFPVSLLVAVLFSFDIARLWVPTLLSLVFVFHQLRK